MKIVALGTSAGGGVLIEKILSELQSIEGVIIVAIHLSPSHIDDFVAYLSTITDLEVKKAEDFEPLKKGRVYVCDSAYDMCYRLVAHQGCLVAHKVQSSIYKPNIDALFGSLVGNAPHETMAVLLSGIGEDGVAGMERLQKAGATTLACDEESAIVYGMPRVAIERGVARKMDLASIIERMRRFLA